VDMETVWIILAGLFVIGLAYAARGVLIGLLAAFGFLVGVNWIAGWSVVQNIVNWVAGWFTGLTPNLDSTGRFVANICALLVLGAVASSIYESDEPSE